MLVEFRVKNFRSFRDEQVFSMVASKDKTCADTHTQATGIKAAPALLRSAVVYGANASGKSNLIKAIQFMRGAVMHHSFPFGHDFDTQPFRLDDHSSEQPTEFEATFILDKVRYQYGFALTRQRITHEYLFVYKAFKPQRWFERHFDASTGEDVYEFGPGFKGAKSVWQDATDHETLFLSIAAMHKSAILRPVYNWFAEKIVILGDSPSLHFRGRPPIQMLQQATGREAICNFLSTADVSIDDISVETRKRVVDRKEYEEAIIRFHHITEQGKATFGLEEESHGTRKLLFLAAPLFDILSKGLILVIDELDASLHTLLVRELISLFYRPESNTGGAQLIFTTHDTSLLDAPGLFRRDQVWFVEKDRNQASKLVGLSEFSPRKNEALERGYLMGRYGGIPLLDKLYDHDHDGSR